MTKLNEAINKYRLPVTTTLMVVGASVPVFASSSGGSSSAVSASDWASVISAMTSQISVSTVVAVLATLVTAGIGLVFMWWGVRKAISSLMSAFRKGRMKL
ncbi:hypothetical protein [[Clostridium] symbiosum]|uniref:hypothetical protein n=1 Tax=Clostridium symbiosum TaxID=1512 RepID=UPI00232ECAC7|nr:hypothetical protein [[Clostridium] symbiosum]MDB2009613.1 hypothetical protein [[Clostridium] symbiosum]MDB2027386.1 hypothetical protein [[Clostridium] symbiosum]